MSAAQKAFLSFRSLSTHKLKTLRNLPVGARNSALATLQMQTRAASGAILSRDTGSAVVGASGTSGWSRVDGVAVGADGRPEIGVPWRRSDYGE